MPKANGKKPQTIGFNEYLAVLRSLKGDALKKWNRAGADADTCVLFWSKTLSRLLSLLPDVAPKGDVANGYQRNRTIHLLPSALSDQNCPISSTCLCTI